MAILHILYQPCDECSLLFFHRSTFSFSRSDFRGYGLNKISFLTECVKAGYNFAVLNKLYVVHLDHPTYSLDKQGVMKNASRLVYTKFMEYNEEKYGDIYKEIFCPECLLMEEEQRAAAPKSVALQVSSDEEEGDDD